MSEYDIDFDWWIAHDDGVVDLDTTKYDKESGKFEEICKKILGPYYNEIEEPWGEDEIREVRNHNKQRSDKIFEEFKDILTNPPLNKRPAHSKKRMKKIKKHYDKGGWKWPSNPEYYFRYIHTSYFLKPEMEIKTWVFGNEEPEEWQGKEFKGAFEELGWYVQFNIDERKPTEEELQGDDIEGTVYWKNDMFQIVYVGSMKEGDHQQGWKKNWGKIGHFNCWMGALEFTHDVDYSGFYTSEENFRNAPYNMGGREGLVTLIKIDPEKVIKYWESKRNFAINFENNPIK